MTNDVRSVIIQLQNTVAVRQVDLEDARQRAEKAEADAAQLRGQLADASRLLQQSIANTAEGLRQLDDYRADAAAHPTLRHQLRQALAVADAEDDGVHLFTEVRRLLAESEASPPAPSGWQQRIAAKDPMVQRMDLDGRWVLRCFFCKAPSHLPDCLWQNAKDALPSSSSEVDAGQPVLSSLCGHTVIADHATDASIECSLPFGHAGDHDYSERDGSHE